MAFWASTTQLVPKDGNCNIKDILGSLKEKHNLRNLTKKIYYTTLQAILNEIIFLDKIIRAS